MLIFWALKNPLKNRYIMWEISLEKKGGGRRKDINTTYEKKIIIVCTRYNEIYIDLFLPDG